jgi:protein phosphatase
MGGHASGEVASQMAIDLISKIYYEDSERSPADALVRAIELANADIYEASMTDEKFFGMGTTVVAMVLLNDSAFSAHVGDSRLYHMNGRQLELLTMDHSEVMELVKQGVISREEADNHEDKNVILRALGTKADVDVDVSDVIPVKLNDEFLLCSDGLCDMLSDDEIQRVWFDAKDIHTASRELIDAAKQRGGHDNVTVGVIRIAPEVRRIDRGDIKRTRETKGLTQ